MPHSIHRLIAQIGELQDQLEAEFTRRRTELQYQINKGRVVFEADVRARHKQAKIRLWAFLKQTRPMVVLTAPFIYGLIVPFVLLDLFVFLYQATCFPVYGITRVRRRDYVFMDRHQLAYLNGLQKLNCLYCGYANGLLAYVVETAARTEQYWCPIKHSRRIMAAHGRYLEFAEFGDAEAYLQKSEPLREKLKQRPD